MKKCLQTGQEICHAGINNNYLNEQLRHKLYENTHKNTPVALLTLAATDESEMEGDAS